MAKREKHICFPLKHFDLSPLYRGLFESLDTLAVLKTSLEFPLERALCVILEDEVEQLIDECTKYLESDAKADNLAFYSLESRSETVLEEIEEASKNIESLH